jgi:hypothetical protein
LFPPGCAAPAGQSSAAARGPIPDDVARDDQRRRDLRNIMQAKLAYSTGLLESIALEDFSRIEYNAIELHWLSRQSDWDVHDTVSYGIFSGKFQEVMEAIADSAARHDIDAAAAGYRRMTASCLDCHAYLRKEGLVKDLPGVVTFADSPDSGFPMAASAQRPHG